MKPKKFMPIMLGIIIGITIKLFIFDIVIVSGSSMEPTIKEGDTLFINKLAYGIVNPLTGHLFFNWNTPAIDDIVIYNKNNRHVVKRCCGIENQPLEYFSNSQYSMILADKTYQLTEEQFQRIKYNNIIPENTIFALGDNRNVSIDSRTYGFVPIKIVFGKVLWK